MGGEITIKEEVVVEEEEEEVMVAEEVMVVMVMVMVWKSRLGWTQCSRSNNHHLHRRCRRLGPTIVPVGRSLPALPPSCALAAAATAAASSALRGGGGGGLA
jgi:hypothetical protein